MKRNTCYIKQVIEALNQKKTNYERLGNIDKEPNFLRHPEKQEELTLLEKEFGDLEIPTMDFSDQYMQDLGGSNSVVAQMLFQ